MKTLKELNEKCTLLCEHKHYAFMVNGLVNCCLFKGRHNTCKLFTDNKGKYYLYNYILSTKIDVYNNYNKAIKAYKNYINNTCI